MVMTAIDNVGDVDYWYEPSVQGGWNEQPVARSADRGTRTLSS